MEENKIEYFLDENGDNLNLEIEAPVVRAIPIQKSLNWKKFNDSAKAYLSGVPIQGLDVDPNSKYSKSWAHNVNSFAKAVAENQSYTISPYKQYTATDLHELARYFNNFDLNTSKIDFGNIKPKKLVKDYVKDHPEASEETQQELLEQFKRLKVNEQTNKRTFKTARRYAGSDQQYKEDRKFYKDLGITGATIMAAMPLGYLATGALTAAVYTAPTWGPWVAKNIVLPWLGGEVVNRATNWLTDGKYDSFGDWIYNGTKLNEWTEGTWLEEPTRFATDMANPGYWAPYNKITKWAGPRIGKFIDDIKWKGNTNKNLEIVDYSYEPIKVANQTQNINYNGNLRQWIDDAIDQASKNKDLDIYLQDLKNIRAQISNDEALNNVVTQITSTNNPNVEFLAIGDDLSISLPNGIRYKGGKWDGFIDDLLIKENLNPNDLKHVFETHPFRRMIHDPYHEVWYRRTPNDITIEGVTFSHKFDPNNVVVSPNFPLTDDGVIKLNNYLQSVNPSVQTVLLGNVGRQSPLNLSNTPISRFKPTIINNQIRFRPIERVVEGPTGDLISLDRRGYQLSPDTKLYPWKNKPPFIMPRGNFTVKPPSKPIEIPTNNELTEQFINFVRNYPESAITIPSGSINYSIKDIYKRFGLGELPDDVLLKASRISEMEALEAAKKTPEIALVNADYSGGYILKYFKSGEPIGEISTGLTGLQFPDNHVSQGSYIKLIQKLKESEKGVARKLYSSSSIFNKSFYDTETPILSGVTLLSPEQTVPTILKSNFTTRPFGSNGRHLYNNGPNVKKTGSSYVVVNSPTFTIHNTTDQIPVKVSNILHPQRIVFKDGEFTLTPLNPTDSSIWFKNGGKLNKD